MQADAGLQDKAETYLKALIVDAQPALTMDFDGGTAFGELGIDSFRVLKLIKRLESDFGTLPKTLLFEHFNVESLAGWLVQRHAQTLHRLFGIATTAPAPASAAPAQTMSKPPVVEKVSSATESIAMRTTVPPADLPASTHRARSPSPAMPMLLLERDLPAHPELQATLAGLYERHRNEGSVSRGTRNIAPNLFVGSARRGYFNYGRCGNALLVYAYTGPDDAFAELAEECLAHCRRHGLQLNLFMDAPVTDIAGVSFSSTPFGVLQRVNDLKSFSLEGGAMRRLRYQVGKFEKAGACDTREYACGSDPLVDREIAAIIDRWCEARPMVNPLIHIVREEILAGSLHPQHRIFLTRLDGVLQNVILISKVSDALNGYLMDLEFYPREMPLGGLEFAIVRIIETLVAEGCDLFSLGGTYGVRLETSPNADPAVDAVLDALHSQGIFNDEGNLQFKNKFRPENRTIYLCRPADGSPADNIVDIIMMIADPDRQTPDTEHHRVGHDSSVAPVPDAVAATPVPVAAHGGPGATPRLQAIEAAGFNPMNLAASEVDHDLKTDSWAQLDSPSIAALMAHLRAQLQQPVDVTGALADVFPFAHVVLTDSGRSADHVLCKAWPRRGRVLQNLLFPTCLYHQLDKGFEPVEIPHPALLSGQQMAVRAGLDLDALRAALAADAAGIAYVCIELADNAAGGLPVSPAHLREVRDLIEPHRIPLVLDATRVVENALQLIDQRPDYAARGAWDLVRGTLALADVVYGSLCKDFCVDRGGLVATNDAGLADRFRRVLDEDGGGLDVIERRLVGLALRQKEAIESRCRRRMASVRTLWTALHAEGVPVFAPAGGHCVLVDVAAMPAFAPLPHPVPAFVAWLYLATGIRAGAHSVGMQTGTALNGLVRLALPVGLEQAQVDDLVARLIRAVRELRDIPELVPASGVPAVGDVHAAYALTRWHRSRAVAGSPGAASAAPEVQAAAAIAVEASLPTAIALREVPATRTLRHDEEIAVVGIGGRYPGAHGMAEFWDVLREGRDCITELPQERLDKRLKHPFTRSYRGGFIEGIDRFDSLFFNISPREAEVLDPQERLFLEVAWETLEDAGYHPEMLAQDPASRDVGVFVGAVWAMYQMVGAEQKLVGRDLNSNSFLWSISNRVSYWMNFSGPSLTVDTACSSSLTALHLACEAIRNGTCSSAIVGGVNLDLHQHKFDINHGGGALSPDGLCRAFGEGANGYVAGEGVGALYLKPLSRAIEDRDQIYGLIRGTMVNHGGRTSGYTVPNPKAQGDLVAAALAKSGVDARSIGYIEAHGTGTELGDPIEIAGLVSAFERDAVPMGSCPIGSVKTNIGHLEAAAGVVGVTKALLQIRHRQLVPSLHSARPNPHIDFADTPFVVQQALAPWPVKRVDGRVLPLRAGISSFGAGGANAHVVVESFDAPQTTPVASDGDHVFPLSARTEEQLREMARRLRADLQRDAQAGLQRELVDIAFTLQEGRKSFEHRMAVVAASLRDLVAGLGAFLEGRSDAGVLVGHAKNAEGVTRLLGRDEKAQFIALLAQGRDPRRLAQLWIDGLLSDCRGFLASGRRVSLPTYPFADKRHWIAPATTAAPLIGARPGLHPLLDSNESTFQRQLFRKSFRAGEFVLADHRVSGVPTLPGTAYLEMARIAGELATGRRVRKVRNITWISPLSAEGDAVTEAIVELRPVSGDVIFEVFSETGDGKRRLFAQGKLVFAETGEGEPAAEYVDLQAIRSRSTKVIDGRDAYPLFRSVGMDYGPSFQVLQEVFRSDDEVLGLLRLPDVRQADFDAFVFHPCLLDASMQAGVAGQLGDAGGEMKVPYSIGEVEWLHPFTPVCYSIVTKMQSDRSGGGGLSRENVDIVDVDGRVLARIRESVGVPLTSVHDRQPAAPRASQAATPVPSMAMDAAADVFEPLFYTTQWLPAPLVAGAARDDVSTVLLFDVDSRLRDSLATKHCRVVLAVPGAGFERRGEDLFALDPRDRAGYDRLLAALDAKGVVPDRICFAWPSSRSIEVADSDAAIDAALDTGVYALLFLCQALAERKLKSIVRLLCLRTADEDATDPGDPLDEALNGFARSVRLESPKLECKLLTVPRSLYASGGLCALVKAELDSGSGQDIAVRHRDGVRSVRSLVRLPAEQVLQVQDGDIALRQRGVYVITGGAGGLGLIFAGYLARQCQARLVLSGRSALPPEREAQLDALRALGAEVHYVAADVSRRDDVERLLAETRARFGRVDGIVHSAGVLRDSFFWKKRREDMAAVLAPKVHGSLHLDAATRDDDLDFFVLFSSLAAFGNAGQCDYGYANSYLDAFAARREFQRARGERRGRTLSLNWSLWADGGMQLDEQTELFFRTRLGIKPLDTGFGLRAFVSGLACDVPQLAVVEGVVDKVETAWGLRGPAASVSAESEAAPQAASGGEGLEAVVIDALAGIVMEMLKVSEEDLSLDGILLDLGFDSIGLTTFANEINGRYGLDINPVMFFEYPSIRAIAGVMATEHAAAVARVHAPAATAGKAVAAAAAAPVTAAQAALPAAAVALTAGDGIDKGWHPDRAPVVAPASVGAMPGGMPGADFRRDRRFVDMPIAIVGMAGVMPQSDNVEAFWENLRDARNLVTEIPRDRWIWEEYDGNPIKETNKSNSRWGGFLRDVDKFDPLFFGITPREAEMMDPQQRIFIETVWSAIEDSGHKVSDLSGTRTGLFVGVSAKDYIDVLAENQSSLDGFSASGNSHSILANRVSFLLNLRGPSAPLDTACSSSLIALHRAIESIHTGSSDMAIVGGVQVMLTPVGHISLSSAGMLSVDGKCKTFDKDANGYVRGEGAGAIFIKTLADAIRDGNPIHAVVRATAENHGGRVTMLTAPNPKAQAELLFEAYDKGEVDPTTVGYIECHGTGTSLGDPIEIQALKKSFADLYRKRGAPSPAKPHCGLSSVKTNIGHLEPAAGIASLLKALMAIRHRQIPALLHFETLNPYIDLDGSPFYIADRTVDWDAPRAADGSELPRVAGVSSFGWGGANAHVVIEEYRRPERAAPASVPLPVVLSARNEARLRDYARVLLAHVRKQPAPVFADLAYTLQVGRDPMEERLAVMAASVEELAGKLDAFLAGDSDIDGVHRGRVSRYKRNEQGLSVPGGDDAAAARIAGWLAERAYPQLAAAWAEGADVDWRALHAGDAAWPARRISLPTYPFARDRHWIETRATAKPGAVAAALHPLVHANTSTLERHRYTTRFTGREPLLVDHARTLPAAACLEMARAAVALALGLQAQDEAGRDAAIQLTDVRWHAPHAGPGTPLHVELRMGRGGAIDCEIHSQDEAAGTARVVHASARAQRALQPQLPRSRLDVQQLRALMRDERLDAAVLDAAVDRLQPMRGPSLRSIREYHRGHRQALAQLAPPPGLDQAGADAMRTAVLLDGALQCAAILVDAATAPSSLAALRQFKPCTGELHAWARRSAAADTGEARVDIDLIDAEGTVCIRLEGLVFEVQAASVAMPVSERRLAAPAPAMAGDEDFATLLDALYRPASEPAGTTAAPDAATDAEFEKMLEEIL